MKQYLTSLLLIVVLFSYAQTNFQKGYFINSNDEKVECLIKNEDWSTNPTEFNYKLSENSDVQTGSISQIKEFSVENESKYVKRKVDIDISSNNLKNLSFVKEPSWETQTVYLKVLLEGDASLYFYSAPGLNRYFYNLQNGKIVQLVYKRYYIEHQKVKSNIDFKQQLLNSFSACNTIAIKDYEKVSYNAPSLSKLMLAYNNCLNSETISFEQSNDNIKFNLKLKGGVNSTTVNTLEHAYVESKNATFGSKLGYRFALEGEVVLPFNNSKWGLFFELAKVQKTSMETENGGGFVKFSYDYFELPLGVRHYFYLNEESKISIHLGYAWDVSSKLDLQYNTLEGLSSEAPSGSFLFGGAYHFNKISIEGRMNFKQVFERNSASYTSDYTNLSLTLGYTIF